MSYTLVAGFTAGRLDTDRGTFRIVDQRVTVDDYDTAQALVADYGLSWLGAAPDAPADDAGEGADTPADAPTADAEDDDGAEDVEDDDGGEAESESDTCGYYDESSMDAPCGRTAGWGRDADTGRCQPHHDIEAGAEE